MSALPITKYAVIFLDVLTSNLEILQVFGDARDALQYMHQTIEENTDFSNSDYFKKYRDTPEQISIFKANWISPKTLIARYFIAKYQDCGASIMCELLNLHSEDFPQ